MSARGGAEAGPIVCVGAHVQGLFMHVERVPREGESVLGWGFREPRDGGKVANVAVAAARLGAPVRLVTVIGTDERSSRWLEYFAAEGIDTRGVIRLEGPMDVGPALLPPSRIPALITVGDLSARLGAGLVHEQAAVIRDASVVVCALESPIDGVGAAMRLGRAAGATTMLNPSPVAEVSDTLFPLVDVLVANEDEASALAGRTNDPAEAVVAIRDRWSIPTVLATAGPHGAFAVSGDAGVLHVPAPAVDVVDTTGAGDAFLGALAAWLRDDAPLETAIAAAISAASLSCTREHTMPAFATPGELETFTSTASTPHEGTAP
jgi:ribokinase